jgi:predicted permease
VLSRINPPDNPAQLALPADWRVLGFGVAVTVVVTFLFGLAPALRASVVRPVTGLNSGGWMRALIALQTAFCVLVLFIATLFVLTFSRLSGQPTGFTAERLLLINTVTRQHEPIALWNQVAEGLRRVPGVKTVAYADWPLLDGYGFKVDSPSVNGAPASKEMAWFMNVSPGWLDAMEIGFVEGRDFRQSDMSPGAAIVNETFARQYFGRENPVGKWFEGTGGYMRGQRFQIVGVVRDARYRYMRQPVLPVAYTPFNRVGDSGKFLGGTFVVRTTGSNPLALAATLGGEIARATPEFRVGNVHSQEELNQLQTLRERLVARLAVFFSGLALLLAVVGLYGVLNYSVQQRRREIGIRMAVGAQAGAIVRLVTMSIFTVVSVGAVAGLAAGIASAPYIEPLLYGVKPTEWSVLAVPLLTIVAATLLASLPGALHAARTDPALVLRAD